MKLLFVAVAALCLAGAMARCPNGCSGHGGCFGSDKCTCWANWQGPDCSQRTCAFDVAWAVDHWNDAHYYAECSAKGLCDRETGECVCFEGYTGRACKRSVCPNDCSGHGKCRLVQELSAATQYAENPYTDWDGEKIQACVCDGGFYGPDCSLRYCPKGDDPMTICDTTNNEQVQQLSIEFADEVTSGTPENDDLVLIFTDNHNETWLTPRITGVWADAASTAPQRIADALMSIPNFKIPSVTVTHDAVESVAEGTGGATAKVVYQITFDATRTSGNQQLLSAHFPLGCMTSGCQPKYKQLRTVVDDGAGPAATITADSVLSGFFGTAESIERDVVIRLHVLTNASAAYNSYAVSFIVDGGASEWHTNHGRVPDNLAGTGVGYDHAPIGHGLFVDFGSRDPTGGVQTISYSTAKVFVTESTTANSEKEDIECSGRGHCDVSNGNCACFEGYYGDHCGQQTILV